MLSRLMSGSSRSLEREYSCTVRLLDGNIVSNDDEMLRWYMHNVRLRNDFRDRDKENWYPTKRNRYRKIDGFMACLDAHAVSMEQTPVWGGENIRADIQFYEI